MVGIVFKPENRPAEHPNVSQGPALAAEMFLLRGLLPDSGWPGLPGSGGVFLCKLLAPGLSHT